MSNQNCYTCKQIVSECALGISLTLLLNPQNIGHLGKFILILSFQQLSTFLLLAHFNDIDSCLKCEGDYYIHVQLIYNLLK